MVPLNGAFLRLFCKCFLLLSPVLVFLFWFTSQQNQSATEVYQLEQKLSFSIDQLDSLRTQIDVITRHKEKIELLLEEERKRFVKENEDQKKRILHLEEENSRLSKLNRYWLESQMNLTASTRKMISFPVDSIDKDSTPLQPQNNNLKLFHPQANSTNKKMDDPFNDHQLNESQLLKEEEKIGLKQDSKKGTEDRDDVGAEKDYIFAREKPRDDLVFNRRATNGNGTSIQQPFLRSKMDKTIQKDMRLTEEEGGRKNLGVGKGER